MDKRPRNAIASGLRGARRVKAEISWNLNLILAQLPQCTLWTLPFFHPLFSPAVPQCLPGCLSFTHLLATRPRISLWWRRPQTGTA